MMRPVCITGHILEGDRYAAYFGSDSGSRIITVHLL